MVTKIILAVLLCAIGIQAKVSYENYKIYNLFPTTKEQVDIIKDMVKNGYEFWSDVIMVYQNSSVMISPHQETEFLEYTKEIGMSITLRIPNLQRLIDAQLIPTPTIRRSEVGNFTWGKYHTINEIYDWLDELQELFPNVVTTVTIGQTLEGRDLKGVIIDFKAGAREEKPLAGMIEGGIHAREWISPATVTWIIKEFLTSTKPDVRLMAETFVWHIFPVINPDGYAYTFNENRMWRKNRNKAYNVPCGENNDDASNGIDLNRNFDFLWMSVGASTDPCEQTYAGPYGASERESQAISKYVQQVKQDYNLIYYFAFHSYSQLILIPYSHAVAEGVLEVRNYGDLYEIAIRGSEKLTARHGTRYTVGTSATILYEVSGSSMDWVKGIADIPITFLFELRDTGANGFLLPPNEIIPNNEEIMDCLLEMNRVSHELGYFQNSGSSTIFLSLTTMCISMMLLFFR